LFSITRPPFILPPFNVGKKFWEKNVLFDIFINKINMAKIIKLTESDITRLVKKVIEEQIIPAKPNRYSQNKVTLNYDCARKVINGNLPKLTDQGTTMLIDVLCNSKYRPTAPIGTADTRPRTPASNRQMGP
jgi:hypothetical protein